MYYHDPVCGASSGCPEFPTVRGLVAWKEGLIEPCERCLPELAQMTRHSDVQVARRHDRQSCGRRDPGGPMPRA